MQGELVQSQHSDEEEVEIAMARARQKIEDNLQLAQARLQERTDWKLWVRKHPAEAVGLAFGLGFLLGARPYL